MYRVALSNEKRLMLKNFYYRLYQQKMKFLKEIEEKIEQLKKEISPIKDPKMLSFYKRKKCELSRHYLKFKMQQRYADFQKRELKSYQKYKDFLSKTSHACVRELFLNHKHNIKENLYEMEKTGVMKFPIA